MTFHAEQLGDRVEVEAWGPGAEWALEQAPATLGTLDDRAGFDPAHPLVRQLHREADGLRLPSTGLVLEALLPAVLSQRVTGFEAKRSFRQLVERWGEPAPGPGGLLLAPEPQVLATLGYYELHVVGVEKRRADALEAGLRPCHPPRGLRDACPGPELRAHLESVPGIGPWTSAEVARVVAGDADAVSVGDFHLKHVITHALGGEPRGTDERMLELLEPFAGHRGQGVRADRVGRHQPPEVRPSATDPVTQSPLSVTPSAPPRSG